MPNSLATTDPLRVAERQKKELDHWAEHPLERPDTDNVDNYINKFFEANIFYARLLSYADLFRAATTVFEAGAGQCWTSCLIKKMFPHLTVTATDFSPHAVASASRWERVFDVKLDRSYACPAYETGAPDATYDIVFVFQAAHHFILHEQSLTELARIVKPGGHIIYLMEPVIARWLHGFAVRRQMRMRTDVEEDFLNVTDMKAFADRLGLRMTVAYNPEAKFTRRFRAAIYYSLVKQAVWLQKLAQTHCDFLFEKPA